MVRNVCALLLVFVLVGGVGYAGGADLSGVWKVETQNGPVYSDGRATFESAGEGRYTGVVESTVYLRDGAVVRQYSLLAAVKGDEVRIELILLGDSRDAGAKTQIKAKIKDGGQKLDGMGYGFGVFYTSYTRTRMGAVTVK